MCRPEGGALPLPDPDFYEKAYHRSQALYHELRAYTDELEKQMVDYNAAQAMRHPHLIYGYLTIDTDVITDATYDRAVDTSIRGLRSELWAEYLKIKNDRQPTV